ncbi:MAG: MBOAT family protein [Parcubacteria group bacterium]|nr:MBOAT family protein [Parcubacteria group bacterium]
MLFNSIHFLIFFPIVVAVYFCLPYRVRWFFLLLASYYFYMAWKPEYAVLILFSTVIDYFVALKMDKTDNKKVRKTLLVFSLVFNLGVLFLFKYFNFFNDTVNHAFDYFNVFYNVPTFDLLLPVGISFYTFQTLSYTIDVYRGVKKPEKHFGIFALYVSFFPQLVAGPIERSTRLLPQFFQKHKFEYTRVVDGLKLMMWGFFKKLVIADNIAILVNEVYGTPTDYVGVTLLLATYLFAFQIYCDFSGYSDIAVGAAKIMGYDLMDNFKRPYFSKSISEFWRRWHISLSSWFKDYLYISLGGNRVSKWLWRRNIFIVFLVTGFWHGANWTFVIWGLLHGFYIIVGEWTKNIRQNFVDLIGLVKYPKIKKYISILITFHLVLISWVFFRADSIQKAWYIIINFFTDFSLKLPFDLGFGRNSLAIIILSIILMESVHLIERQKSMKQFFSEKPIWLCWVFFSLLLWLIILFGNFGHQEFIYFQF